MYVGIIMQHKPIECYTIVFTNFIPYFIYTDEAIIRSRDYRYGRDDSYELLSGVPEVRTLVSSIVLALLHSTCRRPTPGNRVVFCVCKHHG